MRFDLGQLLEIEITEKNGQFELARIRWIFEDGELRGGRITKSK